MRLHENAIRASSVPTDIIYSDELSAPRPWTVSEEMRRLQEQILDLEMSYDRWLIEIFGVTD